MLLIVDMHVWLPKAALSETDRDQTVSVNELCQKEALSAI